MEFIRLWYVDEDYLNSIYNQISENITSLKISEDRVSDKEGEAGFDTGNFFSKMGFPIGLSMKTRYNVKRSVFEEKTITPSVESKIKEVLKHLEPKRALSDIIMQPYKVDGIVLISGLFILIELYYLGHKDKNLIKRTDFIEKPSELVWHMLYSLKVDNSNRQFEESNELFKFVNVDMFLAGEKMRRNIKHITTAIEKYHPFDFDVIGDLEKIDNCTYILKPIILYQTSCFNMESLK